jgi:hypothetical protein
MRVAWLGPAPGTHGGAPYVGTQLLRELPQLGIEVDCFVAAGEDQIPPELLDEPGLRFFCQSSGWQWNRWYSRGPMRAFFTGNLSRARVQFRLAGLIASRHREEPYDLVYQFSQSEMFGLRRRDGKLPPIVVHPSTHAAGELARGGVVADAVEEERRHRGAHTTRWRRILLPSVMERPPRARAICPVRTSSRMPKADSSSSMASSFSGEPETSTVSES